MCLQNKLCCAWSKNFVYIHKTCVYRCKKKGTKQHILNPCIAGGLFLENDWNKIRRFKCCHLFHNGFGFFSSSSNQLSDSDLVAVFLTLLESFGEEWRCFHLLRGCTLTVNGCSEAAPRLQYKSPLKSHKRPFYYTVNHSISLLRFVTFNSIYLMSWT